MANAVNKMLEQSPLPQLVRSLGQAIADAQLALDRHAIALARELQQPIELFPGQPERSLLELGFAPTFYHFTEATIRARVAFSSAESQEFSVGASAGASFGVFTASVNASYSNKYSFTAEGSSEISTRIVSLPAPAALAQILQQAAAPRTAAEG